MIQSISQEKTDQFKALVNKFKSYDFMDKAWKNPYDDKEFAKRYDVLNPWNVWYGNLDAEILLIGQDWGSMEGKGGLKKFDKNDEIMDTDRNLIELFKVLDINLVKLYSQLKNNEYSDHKLFFTNAILGIRTGDKNAGKVLLNSYKKTSCFLEDLIAIIRPKHIIAMGRIAYDSLRIVYKLPHYKKAEEAIANNGNLSIKDAKLFIVAHCSPLGLANRSLCRQREDWLRIKDLIVR